MYCVKCKIGCKEWAKENNKEIGNRPNCYPIQAVPCYHGKMCKCFV